MPKLIYKALAKRAGQLRLAGASYVVIAGELRCSPSTARKAALFWGQQNGLALAATRERPSYGAKRAAYMPMRTKKKTSLADGIEHSLHFRPRTRGDCEDGPRPCPWVSCRHHLLFDVSGIGSLIPSVVFDAADEDSIWSALDGMRFTCSLDAAKRDGMTLEDVGDILGVTRERTRQVQYAAIAKLQAIARGGAIEDTQGGASGWVVARQPSPRDSSSVDEEPIPWTPFNTNME